MIIIMMDSPIGARRMKTDLHTSDNKFIQTNFANRSNSTSPILRRHKITQTDNRCQLPARATRLLNRTRLQSNHFIGGGGGGGGGDGSPNPGSDSPKSLDSIPLPLSSSSPSIRRRTTTPARLTSAIITNQNPTSHLLLGGGGSGGNITDEFIMLDKSLRNSMLHDMFYFKKQLICLRDILQEQDEETLTMTDTLNPFEINNGQFFGSCGGHDGIYNNGDGSSSGGGGADSDSSLIVGDGIYNNNNNNNNINNANTNTKLYYSGGNKNMENYPFGVVGGDETKEVLTDLRRQVVYLQSQIDDKDRTIRIQQSVIEKMESDRMKSLNSSESSAATTNNNVQHIETINSATQTERLRPLSIGPDIGAPARIFFKKNIILTNLLRFLQNCFQNYSNYLPSINFLQSSNLNALQIYSYNYLCEKLSIINTIMCLAILNTQRRFSTVISLLSLPPSVSSSFSFNYRRRPQNYFLTKLIDNTFLMFHLILQKFNIIN